MTSVPGITFWDQVGHKAQDIVLVPTLHPKGKGADLLALIPGIEHYEERQFYFLFLLSDPRTRIVCLTTRPLDPAILRYYSILLHGPSKSASEQAQFWASRLLQLTPNDGTPGALSQKILARPRLVQRIRAALRPGAAALQIVNSTGREEVLAGELGIPLLAVQESLLKWGTKSGSRSIFQTAQIPCAQGTQLVHSVPALAEAIAALYQALEADAASCPLGADGKPSLPRRFVVKLDDGFSGEGNAILDVSFLQSASFPQPKWETEPLKSLRKLRVQTILEQFEVMRFQGEGTTWSEFAEGIRHQGALAEVFLEGEGARSPSGQAIIDERGRVHMLSTHEQILGGSDGQCYLGAHFPCASPYRQTIQDATIRVGEQLAAYGVVGNFSLDFYARRFPGSSQWNLNALEINVRPGGTTHPLMTLKFLTKGKYDMSTGNFIGSDGRHKHYVVSDNVTKPQYRGLTPDDISDAFQHHPLHWNPQRQTGAVFHMLGSLSVYAKVGVTCIANSEKEASEMYVKVVEHLDRMCGVVVHRPKL